MIAGRQAIHACTTNILTWTVCVRVTVCHGCDVTSATYTLNEATRFTITHTLGTSLLTVAADDMVMFIAP